MRYFFMPRVRWQELRGEFWVVRDISKKARLKEYLSLTASILLHHTKNAYFWMCLRKFSWRTSFLIQRNIWKIIGACNISKTAAFPQVFFCHVLILFKVFLVHFSKSVWYHSNSCMLLYTKWKVIFDHIARGNVDTASGCQMMSYPHVDLNRNEHLNLNLENKTHH